MMNEIEARNGWGLGVGSTGLICLRIPQVPYLITKPFALYPLDSGLLKPA